MKGANEEVDTFNQAQVEINNFDQRRVFILPHSFSLKVRTNGC